MTAPISGPELAIRASGVVKAYAGTRAVDGVDLAVQRGETLAILGPNGAGKTTTVEILEGFRKPDSGTVSVLGCNPLTEKKRLKPRIGVMLQEGGLYPAITPREALRLFATFYPNPRKADQLLDLVGLTDAAGTRYRRLSGGQKQRLSLALALLPNPDLLFLDEPTAGMDPQARRATWEILRRLHTDGVTIVLTTHYLEEAERLADRVAILIAGKVAALDTPSALVGGSTSVRIRTVRSVPEQRLAGLASAREVHEIEGGYAVDTDSAADLLVEITVLLRDLGVPITELRVGRGTLEDVFMQLAGEDAEV